MAAKDLGAYPALDNQGDREVCVRSALSKAITGGLEFAKWTKTKFDVNQKFVLGILIGDRDDKLARCSPLILNGRSLKLQNEIDNKWSEFHLVVTEMTKTQFRENWTGKTTRQDKVKEFLIGFQGHCLYVERIERDGEKLHCMNSWGDNNDPMPVIYTQTVEDKNIFSVELVAKPSESDLQLAATITSDSKIVKPRVGKLDQLARLARWGQLGTFSDLYLTGDIRSVDARGLALLACLTRDLYVRSSCVMSTEQWREMAMASMAGGWKVEYLVIYCKYDEEESKAVITMISMTNWVALDNYDKIWQQLADTLGKVGQGSRCNVIRFWYGDKYRSEICLLNTKLGWNMSEEYGDIKLQSSQYYAVPRQYLVE